MPAQTAPSDALDHEQFHQQKLPIAMLRTIAIALFPDTQKYKSKYSDAKKYMLGVRAHIILRGIREQRQIGVHPQARRLANGIWYGLKSNRKTHFSPIDFSLIAPVGDNCTECSCGGNIVLCVKKYQDAYEDLSTLTLEQARLHFVNHGIRERRFRTLNRMFFRYYGQHGVRFLETLVDPSKMIQFMLRNVEEKDLTSFVNYIVHQNSKKTIVYFDIFDTIIYRNVSSPDLIFKKLEEETSIDQLYNSRIEAENICRVKFGDSQYLLKDIYKEIEISETEQTLLNVMQKEIEIEKSCIKTRGSIWNVVKSLISSGIKIELVSDFYLNKDELIDILPKEISDYIGLECIHVSGDYGQTKHSGKLFELLSHERENNDSSKSKSEENYIFVGDNHHSDFNKIKEKEFASPILIPSINDTLRNKYGDQINDQSLKLGTQAHMSIRNEYVSGLADPEFDYFGFCVLGPYLLSTCMLLHNFLQAKHSDSPVFFLERDGHLVKRAFEQICPNRKCYAIANSRTLNLHAHVRDAATLSEVFKRDGCPTSVSDALWRRLGYEICEEQYSALPDSFLTNPNFLPAPVVLEIVEFCRDQSQRYRSYLEKKGLGDNGDYVLFDIGYRGTAAKCFNSLFPLARFSWVYFTTLPKMPYFWDHHYFALLSTHNIKRPGDVLPVLEAIHSDHSIGSALYFTDQGLARRETSENGNLVDIVDKLAKNAFRFLNENRPCCNEISKIIYSEDFAQALVRQLANPNPNFAAKFVGISFEDSFANADSTFIDAALDSTKSRWQSGLNSLKNDR